MTETMSREKDHFGMKTLNKEITRWINCFARFTIMEVFSMKAVSLFAVLLLMAGVSLGQPVPVFEDGLPVPVFEDKPAVAAKAVAKNAMADVAYDWPWLPGGEQARLTSLWPISVPRLKNLWFYRPARYSQRLAITNGADTNALYHASRDDVWGNAPTSFNPNRSFPYATPGGLDGLSGWESHVAVSYPDGEAPATWVEGVEAGAARLLPKTRWAFPEGTVFANMLVADGETFTLRLLEKRSGGWESQVAFRGGKPPAGFKGAGKACVSCHSKAGASEQYGITVRGDDGIFSVTAFREDKLNGPSFESVGMRQLVGGAEPAYQSYAGPARSFAPVRGLLRRR